MSEKETLLNIEPVNDDNDDSEPKNFYLFKIFKKMCGQEKVTIDEIRKSIDRKYEILKTSEILEMLNEKNFKYLDSNKRLKDAVQKTLFDRLEVEFKNNTVDLLFFYAATSNLNRLKEIVKQCDLQTLCQPRYSDSVIIFSLLCGNLTNPQFLDCMDVLIRAGVDINKPDLNGRTAIDHVAALYKKNKKQEVSENLKNVGLKLIEKGIYEELTEENTRAFIQMLRDENLTEATTVNNNDDFHFQKTRLFYWIGKGKTHEFLSFKNIHSFVNCDDGEQTLLQFACKKSEEMHSVVKFLLENGADPNLATAFNKLTPLELAARRKYLITFQELLKSKTLKITQKIFSNFIRWRSKSVPLKFCEMLLESDKLNPQFVHEATGNTPLHYAIRFSHKDAIQKILKRPEVSLLVANNMGTTALDLISFNDLEIYFDYCVAFDRYTTDFNSNDYKMHFRFTSLITGNEDGIDEVKTLSRISNTNHLQQLLTHPLIHTFVALKWFKVEFYYWIVLALQSIMFLSLSISFYLLSNTSQTALPYCIIFTIINLIFKSVFIVGSGFWFKQRMLTVYEFGEVLLMLTLIGSFISVEIRAFTIIEMAVLFLLTAGYHPKIAKWPVMLKTVFKNFTILMLFFSLIVVAFATAFHILFKGSKDEFFESFWKSLFMTYVMITGEFNIREIEFSPTIFGGYIVFFLFAIFMSLVIVNFWTGVTVTDIGNIEKDAEMNASRNVIQFLVFVQRHIYSKKIFRCILPSPLLFGKKSGKYEVDFFINRKIQIDYEQFPKNVGKSCLEKIRSFHYKQENSSKEKSIWSKLEELSKTLNELKNMKCCRQDNNAQQKSVLKRSKSNVRSNKNLGAVVVD